MVQEETNPATIQEALELYPNGEIRLDVEAWLAAPVSLALSDPRGNVGLFEERSPRVYCGHYFFKDRGKKAKELSIEMLDVVFTKHEAEAVIGMTPVENRPAVWMARHLGFVSHGEIDTWVGPCTLFIMTKDEFFSRYKDR